ncbi:MAG: branched-chain amino acid ABC transporter ATP-binding protein/permease [Chlorobium sp.]|nr:MAG: branched-chain amino acid ABC transporter ATP-binding protein/permease [Chlorobium sp.]
MFGTLTLGLKEKTAERIVRLLLFAGLALLPTFWHGQYALGLLTLMAVYGVLLIGLDATVGFLGQVNLAQAALFGLGAYGAALFIQAVPSLPLALVAGIAAAVIPGAALAIPSLRLEGPQFALSTLSFATLSVICLNESESLTNGALGMSISRPSLFGGVALNATNFYFLCLVVLFLAWWASQLLLKSRFGLAIEALRDSPTATDALGIGVLRHKALAFAWGSALAGLAGALHAMNFGYLQPAAFGYDLMVILLLGVVFGGRRSQWGAFSGAAVIAMLPNLLSNRTLFTSLVTFGCLIAIVPPLRSLFSRKTPSFRETAPVGAMAVALALAFFAPNVEDWRKGIFALFLFAAVVGLPDGIAGAVGVTLRKLIRFKPDPLPAATGGIQSPEPFEGLALHVSDLCKSFGGVRAVDNVTVEIKQGETLGLIGPNGSGKTTVVNLISGLYTPDSGSVKIAATRPAPGSLMSASSAGAARTFQNLQPFSGLTALESVMVCQRDRGTSKAMGWLREVNLEEKARFRCSEMSYGDLRFLEIARALSTRPRLLMLDEPAAGMSKPDIVRLVDLVTRIKKAGISILLIEHHQDVIAELSDQVTVMDGGRIIAKGTPDEVRRHPAVIQAYLGTDDSNAQPGDEPKEPSC